MATAASGCSPASYPPIYRWLQRPLGVALPPIYPGLKSCWLWPRSWAQQLCWLTHAEVADPLYCIDEGPVFSLGPVSPLLVFLCFMLRHWLILTPGGNGAVHKLLIELRYWVWKWNSLVYFSLCSLYTKCFVSDQSADGCEMLIYCNVTYSR